jgi:4'-phosphopantetheinyl transferase
MSILVSGELRVERFQCPDPAGGIPATPALSVDTVHVWQPTPIADESNLDWLRGLLTLEEKQRADRFRFDKDRNLFTTARGWLRALAGAYTHSAPERIAFRYSAQGKPELAGGGQDLRFNLSHSGELVLLAFALRRRLGVDVEKIRKDFLISDIAERFFSPAERACLCRLPAAVQHKAFFRCWTRKEAYIKATGDGLSLPLDQFDVSFAPDEPAHILATRPDPGEAERWSLRDLDVGDQYAGALVIEHNLSPDSLG